MITTDYCKLCEECAFKASQESTKAAYTQLVLGSGPLVAPLDGIIGNFAPDAAANLLADKDAKHIFHIERVYSAEVDAYVLTRRNNVNSVITFACNSDGVFAYEVNASTKTNHAQVFHSYYQRLGLSKAEIRRMLEVNNLHAGTGYMSRDKMIRLVDANNLFEAKVTAQDIRLYFLHMHQRICWACRGGKATAPDQVVTEENVIVTHTCGECVHIDFVYPTSIDEDEATSPSAAIASTAALASPIATEEPAAKKKKDKKKVCPTLLQAIDDFSGYCMAVQLGSRDAKDIHLALCKFIAGYKLHGHTIQRFEFDSEGAFDQVRISIAAQGVDLQRATGGRKAVVAERNNRTAKDQWRTLLCSVEYPKFNLLYSFAYVEALRMLNLSYRSANDKVTVHELFTGKKPLYSDYARDRWGSLVTYYRKPPGAANSEPRAADAIIVGRDPGSHNRPRVLNLDNGTIVTKTHLQPRDLSELVLRQIKKLGGITTKPIELLQDDSVLTGEEASTGIANAESTATEEYNSLEDIADMDRVSPVAPGHTERLATKELSEMADAAMNSEDTAPEEGNGSAATSDVAPTPTEPQAKQRAKHLIPEVLRRSTRVRKSPNRWDDSLFAFNLTLKKATKEFGEESAQRAVRAELRQLHEKRVWKPVKATQRLSLGKKVLPSMLFLKDKYDAYNTFEKLKGRLVAGGHMQILHGDDSESPAVNFASVMLMLTIAAKRKQTKRCIDVTGAYLNADLKETEWIRLNKEVAAIFVEEYPEFRDCIQPDGTMIMELLKALYGLKQAGRAWYELLAAKLVELGYTQSLVDRCIFWKVNADGTMASIAVYVDDLLIAADLACDCDALEQGLRDAFKEVTVKCGDQISFLGMQINTAANGDISINQQAYTEKLLQEWGVTKACPYPYGSDFLDEAAVGDAVTATEYLSRCMALMYLAVKTRPDIFYPISVLAGRASTHLRGDFDKIYRVAEYLYGTQNLGLVFRAEGELCVNAYVDASFNCHPNARSHSGFAIFPDMCGSAAIMAKSMKQKGVADSSAESELIALHEMVQHLLWVISLAEELGYPQRGVKINEDNQAVITMINKEQVNYRGRSKFINRKFFSVHQHVESGEIALVYVGTDSNVADFLTKALMGEKFGRFRVDIMGTAEELRAFGIYVREWGHEVSVQST